MIQNVNQFGDPTDPPYPATGNYPAQIIDGAARYELRDGDAPDGHERTEVSTSGPDDVVYLGEDGETLWYKFSTKFDASFPSTWNSTDWGVTNQWHAENVLGISPPVSFGYGDGGPDGHFTLNAKATGTADIIWSTPLDQGEWHDMVMEVTWSQDPDVGMIRLWHNGIPQTFDDELIWHGQTLATGNTKVYYKEGLYRKFNGMSTTGIVHHKGFVCATTRAALYA